jgi:hypothetical protein
MKKNSYLTMAIAIVLVIIFLGVAVLIQKTCTLKSFLLLTIFVPLLVLSIAAFVNGLLNPEKLIKAMEFNILIVFIVEIIELFFSRVFLSSKEFINRLELMANNSNIQIHGGRVGDFISGFIVLAVITSLFSFVGAKLAALFSKERHRYIKEA